MSEAGNKRRIAFLPSRLSGWLLLGAAAIALIALVLGVPVVVAMRFMWLAVVVLLLLAGADAWRSRRAWLAGGVKLERGLPHAFALGVRQPVQLRLANAGTLGWRIRLHDDVPPLLDATDLPLQLELAPQSLTESAYAATPTSRGAAVFGPAHLRVRSRAGLVELRLRLGEQEMRRVFPDFAQVARYAWLAGDRRLAEIGIKLLQRRGQGTDFRQLSEYLPGDEIRHIDWKATLRSTRPIVRQFQDERDQQVVLLLDCGRRMRAAEQDTLSHFDSALNAVVLLAYVALKQGDAVGVQTFASEPASERFLPPVKGVRGLNQLLAGLHDVQASLLQPDYLAAATSFMRRQPRRSLVVLITNFRDEDSGELAQALALLRTRHLVLLASLREGVLQQIIEQPLSDSEAALQVAAAQQYAQQRTQAFNRLAGRDALMVDAEPARLGVDLVNRYRAAKTAGLI